ncbi:MAG: DEAD/DEAH box helicase family protein [Candidatus Dadabacteria bacterium]|nr:DEAD/DEAH box helicase family protein [Candidatus Dadabacteria bacterium]
MDKKGLSETDIRTRYITPAIQGAGWDLHTQIREEYILAPGRVALDKDKERGKSKQADYVLFLKPNIPLAVVEAKNNRHEPADGIQQALEYAGLLDVPFAFSSNGDSFVFHDNTAPGDIETNLNMDDFPSPETLLEKYKKWRNLDKTAGDIFFQDYHESDKEPRYYQQAVVNRAVHRIATGGDRVLLVLATGTGKTQVAFQIIWRLWKAEVKKRILFLTDRNILADQPQNGDFRPFGRAMTRFVRGKTDPSYEIYLGLYQSLTGPQESDKAYQDFSPNFFDLIVVDECHRGSADEDSAWREILEYFSEAAQIGMTATPKETRYTSNIDYFGEPIYTYSLRQGIEDGFLAPYKVVRSHIDKDVEGYRPEPGKLDDQGNPVESRIYHRPEFDRDIVIDERTKIVAKRISDYLRDSDRMHKTIVFCVDKEHAGRMRQALVNENADKCKENPRYVVRIVSGDTEGEAQLDNFRDPESRYPVIAVTSRLLSTGVDVPTCRLIALDREVGSMTEFKQIIGRGTRLHPDSDKRFFTVMDFRLVTNHFADPDFDGLPVQVYEDLGDTPDPEPAFSTPEEMPTENNLDEEDTPEPRNKIYVSGVEVTILGEQVQYLDGSGNLITKDLRVYMGERVRSRYATLSDFLTRWESADRRRVVLDELRNAGLSFEILSEAVGDSSLDPFDLVCHVAFERPTQTRKQRAERARQSDVFTRYGGQAREVLSALLDKYEDGVESFDEIDLLNVSPLSDMGTPLEIVGLFGSDDDYRRTVRELHNTLYQELV